MDNANNATWMNDEKLINKAKSGYFVRSADLERVYCPGGVLYKQYVEHSEKHGDGYRYFNKEQCSACPHKNECYIKKDGKYKNYRVVYFGKAMEKKIDFELDASRPDFEQIEQSAEELWNKHFENTIELPLKSEESFGIQCKKYRYIIERIKNESTVKLENSVIHTKLMPYFKGMKLNQITKEDIIAWLKSVLTLRKVNGKEYPTKYFSSWIYALLSILKLDYENELNKIAQAKKENTAEELANEKTKPVDDPHKNNVKEYIDGHPDKPLKFTCNTNELKHAITFVSKSFTKKPGILNAIQFKVLGNNTVSLVVIDEKHCETLINIPAEVSKTGEVKLAADELIHYINKINSEIVTIELGTEDNRPLQAGNIFIAAKIIYDINKPYYLVPIIFTTTPKTVMSVDDSLPVADNQKKEEASFKVLYNKLNELGKNMINEIIMAFKKCEA